MLEINSIVLSADEETLFNGIVLYLTLFDALFDDKMIIKTCLKRIVNTYRTHVDYIKKELHWPKSGATPLFGSNWNQFLIFSGLNSESKTSFYPFNKFRQNILILTYNPEIGKMEYRSFRITIDSYNFFRFFHTCNMLYCA